MSHTPGPWEATLGQYELTNSGQRTILTDDDNRTHIAYVTSIIERKRSTRYDAPDETRDANARLIAAAPDLLAALRKMLVSPSVAQVQDQARSAIAKATGSDK